MNNIIFEKNGACLISVTNWRNEISFLFDPVFNNSKENLIRDIEMCNDTKIKKYAKDFLKELGLNNAQSDAILSLPMNQLSNLEYSIITDNILWCDKALQILHKIKSDE